MKKNKFNGESHQSNKQLSSKNRSEMDEMKKKFTLSENLLLASNFDNKFCANPLNIRPGNPPSSSTTSKSRRKKNSITFINSYRFHPLRWNAGTVSRPLHNQFHHLLIFSHKQMASPRSLKPSDGSVWRSLRVSFSLFRAKQFRCHWFSVAFFRAPNEVKRIMERSEQKNGEKIFPSRENSSQ